MIEQDGRVLACQRPGKGVNARLWEFPSMESTATSLEKALAVAKEMFGFRPDNGHKLGVIRHSITHHRYVMIIYGGSVSQSPSLKDSSMKWLSMGQVRHHPFAAAHRKAAKWLDSKA